MSDTELSAPVPQPKKRPALLDKRDRQAAQTTTDRKEREKCHKRSGGRCEVRFRVGGCTFPCGDPVRENHHLIGGMGMRNRGRSILAEHRIDCCKRCHDEITGNVLKPLGKGRYDAATVVYERIE